MNAMCSIEAEESLTNLLEKVIKGERIQITRHGVPVALLIPVEAFDQEEIRDTINRIKAFRHGRTLGDLSIGDMIQEGRK